MFRRFIRVWAIALSALLVGVSATAQPVQIASGDLRLNGELRVPEGRSLKDGVVLVTHGMMAHHRMEIVVALQDTLAERGIPTLAISLGLRVDNRAGMFDCNANPNRHTQEDSLTEIGLWLDWLKGRGANRIAVLGHSAGGSQTARFMATRDEPAVQAAVLLAPGTRNLQRMQENYGGAQGMDDLAAMLAWARAAPPNAMRKGVKFQRCDNATVSAETFLSYYDNVERWDTPRLLTEIAKPVLVIAGTEDRVVGDLPARVGPLVGNNRQLVVIQDAGHFFRDLFMEDVADAVAEFLEKRL